VFPWMADPRLDVREVDPAALADEVSSRTAAVCFSVVRSNDGRVLDGDGIRQACHAAGALAIADVTQATGWLPLRECGFDAVVGGAYKWLSAPRGTAFMAVTDELRSRLAPTGAGWFAGEDPMSSLYGGPLRLARTARALDVSPAWLPWVGTAAALALVEEIGVETIQAHDLELANSFRAQVGLAEDNTPIVSVLVPGVEDELAALGIRTSVREGRVRLSFHCWNSTADVDLAATAVRRARNAA